MKALFKFAFWLIVIAIVIAVIGRLLFFHVARTDSFSMIPNLVPGDTFLIYTRGVLGSGDIAVCRNPENPSSMVVLRVLAVPGSTISMRGNILTINGSKIDHVELVGSVYYVDNTSGEHIEYVANLTHEYVGGHEFLVATMSRGSDYNFDTYTVKEGFYLIGDNRNRSRDSRHFKEVPIRDCIGQAIMVLWPAQDSGELKRKDRILEWLL